MIEAKVYKEALSELTLIECFLHIKHYPKDIEGVSSVITKASVLSVPLCGWEKGGTDSLGKLPKTNKLARTELKQYHSGVHI